MYSKEDVLASPKRVWLLYILSLLYTLDLFSVLSLCFCLRSSIVFFKIFPSNGYIVKKSWINCWKLQERQETTKRTQLYYIRTPIALYMYVCFFLRKFVRNRSPLVLLPMRNRDTERKEMALRGAALVIKTDELSDGFYPLSLYSLLFPIYTHAFAMSSFKNFSSSSCSSTTYFILEHEEGPRSHSAHICSHMVKALRSEDRVYAYQQVSAPFGWPSPVSPLAKKSN